MSTGRDILTRRSRTAFSMVEFVLVAVIIAILAALTVPRYANSLNYYRADLASKRIAADLTMARNNAFSAGTTRTVSFDANADRYVMSGIADLDKAGTNSTVNLAASPYYANIVSAAFGTSGTSASFNGYGMITAGGQVVVSVGTFQKTITVDANDGKVKVQ